MLHAIVLFPPKVMHKKVVITSLIAMMSVIWWVSFSSFFGGDAEEISRMLNAFPAEQTANYPSKREVVERFCQAALSEALQKGISAIYKSQNSLFVKILCKGTNMLADDAGFSPFIQDPSNSQRSYLKANYIAPKEDYVNSEVNYGKSIDFPRACQTSHLKKCRLDRLSYVVMMPILDELFMLKKARMHGIVSDNFTSDKVLEEAIHSFTQHWIFGGEERDGEITDNFCVGQNHRYPQTCALMKQAIRQFKPAFWDLKIIDRKRFFENSFEKVKAYKEESKNYCYFDPKRPNEYDFLFCQLMFSQVQDFSHFVSLIYNELLWQSLFSAYSAHQLGLNPNLTVEQAEEIQGLAKVQELMIRISNQTLQELSEFQSAYPLHIGMLVYQEDLLWLRDKYLSKLVNPFYSLFYKLQNVQIPSSS